MAITNAQQYQQLVNPPMEGKKRPGYRGDDAARSSEGTSAGRADPGAGAGFGDGPSRGISGGNTAREQGIMNQYQGPGGTTLGFDRGPTEIIGGKEFPVNPPTKFEEEQKNFAISIENDRRRREARKRALRERTFLEKLGMLGYTNRTLDDNLVDFGAIDKQFETIGGVPTGFVGPAIGALTVDPATKSFDIDSIRELASTKTTTGGSMSAKDTDTLGDIREDIQMRDRILDPNDKVTQEEFNEYMNRNKTITSDSDELDDPCKGPNPPAYCFVGIRSAEAVTPEKKIEETFTPNLRLLAGGGMAERAPYEGGIMDLESARQMYGLGKLVKKVTRSVKKIAKSPVGKVAIGAALFKFGAPMFGKGSFNPFLKIAADGSQGFSPFGAIARKLGIATLEGGLTGFGKIAALGVPSIIAGLTAKTDEDDNEEQNIGADLPFPVDYYLSGQYAPNMRLAAEGGLMRQNYDEAGAVMSKEDMEKMAKSPLYKGFKTMYSVDPNMARDNKSYKDKFEQFEQLFKKGYQKGGDVEPVAKKTMPLLDMGGMEKDYREEGGFVPIGRMEKADDVPARLSKNEFVFTAEAVRNAGDGDVDLGAEKMYNMMKNLEAGGDVSEESQGMDGARKMFQTSQRLEEVI